MTQSANPDVARMFNRIARTYDLLNRVLSLGIDRGWRAAAIKRLNLTPNLQILDCGAGTGDMSIAAHEACRGIQTVLLDPAYAMLAIADTKAGIVHESSYRLLQGAAEGLPFADESFDRFMVAFGVRNFADLETGLRELYRTLKRGGRGVILEFTPDRSRVIDRIFRWYMRFIMTPLGGMVSRDREAYAYLSRTVQSFTDSDTLIALLKSIGFEFRENKALSWGIARILVIDKKM